ncbi:MAG: hypothetical protein HY553_00585 [Elusimicrobia bacterium]|nr:hypothetical protein [Elusimicrobiota bacterium]
MSTETNSHELLRVAGILLVLTGLLALIAANRETPILGAGMVPVGTLLLVARAGAKRAWRGFPAIPLVVAALVALVTAWAFHGHMDEFRKSRIMRPSL